MAKIERDFGELDLKAEFDKLEKMKIRALVDFEKGAQRKFPTLFENAQVRSAATSAYATALLAQIALKKG